MAVFDLVTLAEFQDFLPRSGSARASAMRVAISRASRELEGICGRRLVYRAPPAAGESVILSAFTWPSGSGAPAVTNAPNSAGRTLIVSWTAATAGTLTVTGTVAGASTTEVFDAANGLLQHGVKFFTAVASLAIANGAGAGSVTITPSLGYVDYYTIPCGLNSDRSILRLLDRPVQQVLSVHEDGSLRTYAAATLLVVDTDYRISKSTGRLERVSGGLAYAWDLGRRAGKVINSAGYFGTANVPTHLKGHALHLAAQYYIEAEKGQIEVASGSNALGSWTRMGAAGLTRKTYDALWSSGELQMEAEPMGERDFDLELVA